MTARSRPLAIVAALQEELAELLAGLQSPRMVHHGGREFHLGQLDGHEVVMVLSRVGKVAAATTTTLLAERFHVGQVVFTGVAGGLGEDVKVGDVVVARSLLQHDMDASPLFPRHEVPLTGHSRFAADGAMSDRLAVAARLGLDDASRWLVGADGLDSLGIHAPRVHEGLVISGDRFVSTAAESLALRTELPQALAVEMEGAAVAQVCHDLDLPFAVLRTVSDRADDQAHVDFQRFVREVASRYSAAIVRRWLHQSA